MHPNVDLTFKNLQFCFPSDKQAHIFLDPMIKINSYMGEKHLEPYISP